MSFRHFLSLLATLLLFATLPGTAGAQQVDVIRGRVIGPDSQPLPNVQITVTSQSGNVNRTGKSDRNGRFSITFPNGDGNYIVSMSAVGYALKRFELRRVADEDFLLADAKLSKVGAVLDQVNVTASRDKVSRGADAIPDISGTERPISTTGLPPDMIGDLAAMAATLPGVQLDPNGGFSSLGLGGDQNSTTLGGLNFGGSGLPRDAGVGSSLTTSAYDVSRGGFSGSQLSLRPLSGSNFIRRGLSTTLDAPQMQWSDRIAQSLGNEYSSYQPSGSISGPLIFDKAFYNITLQLGRQSNPLQTLLNTDPTGLQAAGISADSVTRLTNLLGNANVPSTYGGLPNSRLNDQGSLFGTFDFTPPSSTSGQAWQMVTYGSWTKQNPAGNGFPGGPGGGIVIGGLGGGQSSSRSLPTTMGQTTSWNAGVQARQSAYFGFGILTETAFGVSGSQSNSDPYLDLPSGRVRVNSSFLDGSSGVQTLSFGGSSQTSLSSTNSLSATNALSWFSANNKHRLKFTSELRRDASSLDFTSNRFGTFAYNSLADLESNHASMYSRTLYSPRRDASEIVGGLSLGDSYRRTQNLQLQYGVRLDANRYLVSPTRNDAVEERFGLRNDLVPNKVFVSPRAGFSYTYGQGAQLAAFPGAFRGPRAVIRGGAGVFQNSLSTTLISSALASTGLPSGVQQLLCIGNAVPTPQWGQFALDPANIPEQCADGSNGTVQSSSAPSVVAFAPGYQSPRSYRSNLSWGGPTLNNRFMVSLDGIISLNKNQGNILDRNFAATERFSLANEGGRPVYSPLTDIFPSTGSVPLASSRVDPAYGRVTEMRSDLTSISRQMSLRVSPISFNNNFSWNAFYVYMNVREQYQGFSSTAGDPLQRDWSRSSFDSRHQIGYSLSYNAFDFVRISWNSQFRSGSPYTPLVSGDVNGDGYSNDRAFVFDPASTNDAAVKQGMQALLANGSDGARSCLSKQLNNIAARNSCQGPWMQTANLTFSFNPLKVRMPQRAQLSFSVSNPLGAADLLMHGENKLHHWGQATLPDANLLYVRGFDPAAKAFKYEVNQGFGRNTNTTRSPVRLTAFLRYDIGPVTERQLLTQSLDRGRKHEGAKTMEPMLKAQFGNPGVLNPMATILRDQDTLKLSANQADSIATINRRYIVRLDSIWSPVAKWWASLPDNYDQGEAYARYRAARELSIDMLLQYAPVVKKMLTAEQYRRLPPQVARSLDTRFLKSVRSGTAGQAGSGIGGMPMMMGGGAGTQIIMTGGGGGISR